MSDSSFFTYCPSREDVLRKRQLAGYGRWGVFALLVLGLILLQGRWLYTPILMMFFGIGMVIVGAYRDSHEWLSASKWASMAKLCDRYPELQAYQAKVIAHKRPFTSGEYLAARAWAREHRAHDAKAARRAQLESDGHQLYHGAIPVDYDEQLQKEPR